MVYLAEMLLRGIAKETRCAHSMRETSCWIVGIEQRWGGDGNGKSCDHDNAPEGPTGPEGVAGRSRPADDAGRKTQAEGVIHHGYDEQGQHDYARGGEKDHQETSRVTFGP